MRWIGIHGLGLPRGRAMSEYPNAERIRTIYQLSGGGDILATDAHVVVLVRHDHEREDRRFQQLGTEVFHLDENGQIKEFWALIDDTVAFDEFFA